jgi:hypothetical protein
MVKKILLAFSLLIGLTAASAFSQSTTAEAAQISPITYVKSTLSVGSTQDTLQLTWKYVDLAYGYNV